MGYPPKRNFKLLTLIIGFTVLFSTEGCIPKVTPNEWVLVTSNCWNSMSVVEAGDVAPRLMTSCDRKIVLPKAGIDGEVVVSVRFKGDVKADVKISYMFQITDPRLYVKHAKSILSSPTDAEYRPNTDVMEKAENAVIDIMIKNVVREYANQVLATDKDESDIETDVVPLINKRLADRGVEIFDPSVDLLFGQQTEAAFDVISANNLYKSAGIESLGSQVISNQALKPDINVSQKSEYLKED